MSEQTRSKSLAEAYPEAQARLRELIRQYESIGPAGTFGLLTLRDVQQRADKASAEQDTAAMVRLYQEMQDCE
jgi:hypothetical protein